MNETISELYSQDRATRQHVSHCDYGFDVLRNQLEMNMYEYTAVWASCWVEKKAN